MYVIGFDDRNNWFDATNGVTLMPIDDIEYTLMMMGLAKDRSEWKYKFALSEAERYIGETEHHLDGSLKVLEYWSQKETTWRP